MSIPWPRPAQNLLRHIAHCYLPLVNYEPVFALLFSSPVFYLSSLFPSTFQLCLPFLFQVQGVKSEGGAVVAGRQTQVSSPWQFDARGNCGGGGAHGYACLPQLEQVNLHNPIKASKIRVCHISAVGGNAERMLTHRTKLELNALTSKFARVNIFKHLSIAISFS